MDKKLYNDTGARIVSKYKKIILPFLCKYEKKRKEILNRTAIILFASILAMTIIFPHMFNDGGFVFFFYVFLLILILLIDIIIVFKLLDFKKELKKEVMLQLCSCFDDLKWCDDYDDKSAGYCFEDSDLFLVDETSNFIYDDVFFGNFKNILFSIYELSSSTESKLEDVSCGNYLGFIIALIITSFSRGMLRRAFKRTGVRVTQFKGIVIKVQFNKLFKNRTIIRPDNCTHISPNPNLRHTTLEDVEFEKKFDVFTDDEIEARYLITTAFMERLNNISAAFSINNVSCSFYNDNLLIALHTNENLFEPIDILKPLTDYKSFSKMTKEILSIYKLIDYFKLTESTKI